MDPRKLLGQTSRTFALCIDELPAEVREPVSLAYLLLRVSDYFEDSENISPALKIEALGLWARMQDRAAEGLSVRENHSRLLRTFVSERDLDMPDRLAAQESDSILAAATGLAEPVRRIILSSSAASTRGMANWVGRGPDFPDEAALDRYMFEVAGRVGIMLTRLFVHFGAVRASNSSDMVRLSTSFGLGLQTVNVIRGLHEDPKRGWLYVPARITNPAGEEEVLSEDPSNWDADTRSAALGFLVDKADRHLLDALVYCRGIRRTHMGVRRFCLIPAYMALRTLAVSRENLEVFEAPVKIERRQVAAIIGQTRALAWSNIWIRSLHAASS